NKIKDLLGPRDLASPTLPEDDAKLVADVGEFDKELKPYLGMAEAREYQGLVHQFVAITRARNAKILEYESLIAQMAAADAEVRHLRDEGQRVAELLARKVNPKIPDF